MIQLTNEEASRLSHALAVLEGHERGTATILLADLVKKLEPAATVWDCQQRAAMDLKAGKYDTNRDILAWIGGETSDKEFEVLISWLAAHAQGATEPGRMTIGGFLSLEG